MTDDLDKIRLNIALMKEKWKRMIYTRWVKEMNDRRTSGECPKCGVREWYQLKTGFRAKWQCEKCGLTINKLDVAKGQKWWDYIALYAKEEIKRKKKARRQSQSVKDYEHDMREGGAK